MIDWRMEIKHPVTAVWVEVPFSTGNINMKFGMDVSRSKFTLGDTAGYKFSWIQDAEELKIYKNDVYFYRGWITKVTGKFDRAGEKIVIDTDEYWHFVLRRRLTAFERFGTVTNINPTTLAKVAIGTRTFITEDGWEADKITRLKFGTVFEELGGTSKFALGIRNDNQYTMMAYMKSIRWRVDEPSWQGSSDMESGVLTVTEILAGGASYFWLSRDDGESYYELIKSAEKTFTGSETVKDKAKYKIGMYPAPSYEDNLISGDTVISYKNPSRQNVVRTRDGTIHTIFPTTGTSVIIRHSRNNGKGWALEGTTYSPSGYLIVDVAICDTPNGDLGFVCIDNQGTITAYVLKVDKSSGVWTWAYYSHDVVSIGQTTSVSGVSCFGFNYYDTSDAAFKDAYAFVFQDTHVTLGGTYFAVKKIGETGVRWNSQIGYDVSAINGIWCHRNWGNASSKPVIFVGRSGEVGNTQKADMKWAEFTDGVSPVWSSNWATVDSGSCNDVDLVSDRIDHLYVTEDYNIYLFYQKGTTLYAKSTPVDDLVLTGTPTWTVFDVHNHATGIVGNHWDVTQFVDKNIMAVYEKIDTYYYTYLSFYRDGNWYDSGGNRTSNTSYYVKIAQECIHGFGDAVFADTDLTTNPRSMEFMAASEQSISAMEIDLKTDTETGIEEGSMTSFTNADLSNVNVSYAMNRENRLSMLHDIQSMFPTASGSSSPYPFWDMNLREENGVCYLDIAEELGSSIDVVLGHADEGKQDIVIKELIKNIDKAEIINALTLAGGGWTSGGVEVIPIKNVATTGVEAETETQLAGTVINKRISDSLTIENIAYTILNVTSVPKITISCRIKGRHVNDFQLGDKVVIKSDRFDYDTEVKVMEMNWGIKGGETELSLVLDNGSKTLDKYLVQVVTNLNSMGFSEQGELTRPPIFMTTNFTKDSPALLRFYVPDSKKVKKALLYVKTKYYISSEASQMVEYGYYPQDVRLYVDDIFSEEFGGRGGETTAVDVRGIDITKALDADEDGLIDSGVHNLRFTSATSPNNTNGLGRIEAYLVLLESET